MDKKIKQYLKKFEEQFHTKINRIPEQTYILQKIYESFIEQIYSEDEHYLSIAKTMLELEKQIDKSFTKEQKQLFEKWKYCESNLKDDIAQKSFTYGWAISSDIAKEIEKLRGCKKTTLKK